MDFHERLYELRKQKGLSQEELANKLLVTRQTISKWELGDSTPDMEKLISLSDLFGISLDRLMLGKEDTAPAEKKTFFTPEVKKRAAHGLKIAGIIAAAMLAIDLTSLLVWLFLFGLPK